MTMADAKSGTQLPAAATAAVARGSKVEAIKEVRAATGLGLLEAKQLVENYIAANPVLKDQFEQQNAVNRRRLIRWMLVIDAVIVAAVLWWLFGS